MLQAAFKQQLGGAGGGGPGGANGAVGGFGAAGGDPDAQARALAALAGSLLALPGASGNAPMVLGMLGGQGNQTASALLRATAAAAMAGKGALPVGLGQQQQDPAGAGGLGQDQQQQSQSLMLGGGGPGGMDDSAGQHQLMLGQQGGPMDAALQGDGRPGSRTILNLGSGGPGGGLMGGGGSGALGGLGGGGGMAGSAPSLFHDRDPAAGLDHAATEGMPGHRGSNTSLGGGGAGGALGLGMQHSGGAQQFQFQQQQQEPHGGAGPHGGGPKPVLDLTPHGFSGPGGQQMQQPSHVPNPFNAAGLGQGHVGGQATVLTLGGGHGLDLQDGKPPPGAGARAFQQQGAWGQGMHVKGEPGLDLSGAVGRMGAGMQQQQQQHGGGGGGMVLNLGGVTPAARQSGHMDVDGETMSHSHTEAAAAEPTHGADRRQLLQLGPLAQEGDGGSAASHSGALQGRQEPHSAAVRCSGPAPPPLDEEGGVVGWGLPASGSVGRCVLPGSGSENSCWWDVSQGSGSRLSPCRADGAPEAGSGPVVD